MPARLIFLSLDDVLITRAPPALVNCKAAMETPPVPRQSTVSPGFTGLPETIRAFQAVTAAQGRVAACSNEIVFGLGTMPSSCRTMYSASVPSRGLPRAGCRSVIGPEIQL